MPVSSTGSVVLFVRSASTGSVELEGMRVNTVGKRNKLLAHIEDSNGDGFDDLVVLIEDIDGVFEPGDDMATLTGVLLDGTCISGTDLICILP